MAKLILIGSADEQTIQDCNRFAQEKGLNFKRIETKQVSSNGDTNFDENTSLKNVLLIKNASLPEGQKNKKYIKSLEKMEVDSIIEALETTNGNVSKVSKILGVGRATIYRKIKQFDINLQQKRNPHYYKEEDAYKKVA